jgi:hypothetical protein
MICPWIEMASSRIPRRQIVRLEAFRMLEAFDEVALPSRGTIKSVF